MLAGGIAGGILGPELSKLTRDALAATYAGTFAALALTALVALAIASRLPIPNAAAHDAASARPLGRIVAQPQFAVAMLASAVAFGVMNLLMTATPLAMQVCGFGYPESAGVIKWHVIGMFAPGFFTGALIRRFGAHAVMLGRCGALFATVLITQHGASY